MINNQYFGQQTEVTNVRDIKNPVAKTQELASNEAEQQVADPTVENLPQVEDYQKLRQSNIFDQNAMGSTMKQNLFGDPEDDQKQVD